MNDPTPYRKQLRLIDKHMVLSLQNWRAGRWWTLLTSTVTHYDPIHLAVNMVTLCSCGPGILLRFGIPTFVTLWILGGVAGGATQLYIDQRSRRRGIIRKGLGASACLCAMEAVLTCANPNAVISMSGLYLPQWLGTVAFAGWSVVALKQGWEPGIGHEAHLGGLAAGIVVWFGALRWFTPSRGLQVSRLYGS
jgi:membrane associated rhomboid family serine protease